MMEAPFVIAAAIGSLGMLGIGLMLWLGIGWEKEDNILDHLYVFLLIVILTFLPWLACGLMNFIYTNLTL